MIMVEILRSVLDFEVVNIDFESFESNFVLKIQLYIYNFFDMDYVFISVIIEFSDERF